MAFPQPTTATATAAARPESPPDIMDLISLPTPAAAASSVPAKGASETALASEGTTSETAVYQGQPQEQQQQSATSPSNPSISTASSSSTSSAGTGRKVVLEKRPNGPTPDAVVPAVTPSGSTPSGASGASSSTSPPAKPDDNELSADEKRRMRIHAASEAYRRMREQSSQPLAAASTGSPTASPIMSPAMATASPPPSANVQSASRVSKLRQARIQRVQQQQQQQQRQPPPPPLDLDLPPGPPPPLIPTTMVNHAGAVIAPQTPPVSVGGMHPTYQIVPNSVQGQVPPQPGYPHHQQQQHPPVQVATASMPVLIGTPSPPVPIVSNNSINPGHVQPPPPSQIPVTSSHQQNPQNIAERRRSSQDRPSIDLGELVRSTIINQGVTKVFSQHWISLADGSRVLLLDFEGQFTLLIPNIKPNQSFTVNTTNVDVETKVINNGQKLTFFKFQFQSPALEVTAPVLSDKAMGEKVLKQNGACVFLGRVFKNVSQPPPPQQQQLHRHLGPVVPVPGPMLVQPVISHQPTRLPQSQRTASLAQVLERQQQQEAALEMASPMPSLPKGTVMVPSTPSSTGLIPPPPGPPVRVSRPMFHQQPQQVQVQPQAPPAMPIVQPPPQFSNPSPPVPPSKVQSDETSKAKKSDDDGAEEKTKTLTYPDSLTSSIYVALKSKELHKITDCRYCDRVFKFLAEHLSHLKKHTSDVESVVEMTMKMWVPDRKLKCNQCKYKTCYTLDYARHIDGHSIPGLACSICQCEVSTPKAYGEHMEIHHPSLVFHEEHAEPKAADAAPVVSAPAPAPVHIPSVEPQSQPRQEPEVDQPQKVVASPVLIVPKPPLDKVENRSNSAESEPVAVKSPNEAGAEKVLESLLDGSPSVPPEDDPAGSGESASVNDMPVLESHTRKVSIRESLDSHEDELLEDLASFREEMSSQRRPPENHDEDSSHSVNDDVENLANDIIDKIDEQEFSNDEDEVMPEDEVDDKAAEDEDLDLDLHLSENSEDEDLHKTVERTIFRENALSVPLTIGPPPPPPPAAAACTPPMKMPPLSPPRPPPQPQLHQMEVTAVAQQQQQQQHENKQQHHQSQPSSGSESDQHSPPPRQFKCSTCGTEFVTPTSLKIHNLKCVKSQQQSTKTAKTTTTTTTSPSTIPKAKPSPVEAELRPKAEDKKQEQQRQEAKGQVEEELLNICEYCHDEFRSTSSLKTHRILCKRKRDLPTPPPPQPKQETVVKTNESRDQEKINEGNVFDFSAKPQLNRKIDTPTSPSTHQKEDRPSLKIKLPKVVGGAVTTPLPVQSSPKPKISISGSPSKTATSSAAASVDSFAGFGPRSILTEHLNSYKPREQEQSAEGVNPRPSLKLKISLPQASDKKKFTRQARSEVFAPTPPPKPTPPKAAKAAKVLSKPILGQFVTRSPAKSNGLNGGGPRGRGAGKAEVALAAIPKLVIKKNSLDNLQSTTSPPIPKVSIRKHFLGGSTVPSRKETFDFREDDDDDDADDEEEAIPVKQPEAKVLPKLKPCKVSLTNLKADEINSRLGLGPSGKQEKIVVKKAESQPPPIVPKLKIKLDPPPTSKKEEPKSDDLKKAVQQQQPVSVTKKRSRGRPLDEILNNLTFNLPQFSFLEEPQLSEDSSEDEDDEVKATATNGQDIPGDILVANVEIETAFNRIENLSAPRLTVHEILKEVLANVVGSGKEEEIQEKVPDPVMPEKKEKKPKSEFTVIRVSQSKPVKVKRSGSGLSLSDYKNSRRKKGGKKKKLDKLIIRNVSKLTSLSSSAVGEPIVNPDTPVTPSSICKEILADILNDLPCWGGVRPADNNAAVPSPIKLTINKNRLKMKTAKRLKHLFKTSNVVDVVPPIKMKALFDKSGESPPKPTTSDLAAKKMPASFRRQLSLKKQLGIDMVEQNPVFEGQGPLAVGRRKAKLEASKNLAEPKRVIKKSNKDATTTVNNNLKDKGASPPKNNKRKAAALTSLERPSATTKRTRASSGPKSGSDDQQEASSKSESIADLIGKFVRDDVSREMGFGGREGSRSRSSSPTLMMIGKQVKNPGSLKNRRSSAKKELWITSASSSAAASKASTSASSQPQFFARKSVAPPPSLMDEFKQPSPEPEVIVNRAKEDNLLPKASEKPPAKDSLVKTALNRIQLGSDPDSLQEESNPEVLTVIDELFDTFFEQCDAEGQSTSSSRSRSVSRSRSTSRRASTELPLEQIVADILDGVIDEAISQVEQQKSGVGEGEEQGNKSSAISKQDDVKKRNLRTRKRSDTEKSNATPTTDELTTRSSRRLSSNHQEDIPSCDADSESSQAVVTPIALELVDQAVNASESKANQQEVWEALLATAKPALPTENPDLTDNTLSSEQEDNNECGGGGGGLAGGSDSIVHHLGGPTRGSLVPCTFNYEDIAMDDDTATSDARTSHDETSEVEDQSGSRSAASKTASSAKKKKAGAFSRSAYTKRRRQRRLPMSQLAIETPSQSISSGSAGASKRRMSSDNEKSSQIKKSKESVQEEDDVVEAGEPVSLFVRDEITVGGDSSNKEVTSADESNEIDLGKGKRKRYKNVRMMPIDDVVTAKSPARIKTS